MPTELIVADRSFLLADIVLPPSAFPHPFSFFFSFTFGCRVKRKGGPDGWKVKNQERPDRPTGSYPMRQIVNLLSFLASLIVRGGLIVSLCYNVHLKQTSTTLADWQSRILKPSLHLESSVFVTSIVSVIWRRGVFIAVDRNRD